MLEESEVQEIYDNISKSLKDLDPDNEHFKTVYDSQLYILEKVLQKSRKI